MKFAILVLRWFWHHIAVTVFVFLFPKLHCCLLSLNCTVVEPQLTNNTAGWTVVNVNTLSWSVFHWNHLSHDLVYFTMWAHGGWIPMGPWRGLGSASCSVGMVTVQLWNVTCTSITCYFMFQGSLAASSRSHIAPHTDSTSDSVLFINHDQQRRENAMTSQIQV